MTQMVADVWSTVSPYIAPTILTLGALYYGLAIYRERNGQMTERDTTGETIPETIRRDFIELIRPPK